MSHQISVAHPTQRRPSTRATRRSTRPLLYSAATIVLGLLIWVILTDVTGFVPSTKLPSPLAVVSRLGSLAVHPFGGATLFGHARASMLRWAIGVLLAVVVGILLGLAIAWVPILRAAIFPTFEFLRFIPPIAWIPLAVLWFGASTKAQAMVVFIAAFPPAVINASLGVSQVDRIFERAALTLGASQWTVLRRVVVPQAAPSIFAGVRISVSNGWMALVGAELIVGTKGLGALIISGQNDNSTPTIVGAMACIGLIGAAVDILLRTAQKRLLPWRTEAQKGRSSR